MKRSLMALAVAGLVTNVSFAAPASGGVTNS